MRGQTNGQGGEHSRCLLRIIVWLEVRVSLVQKHLVWLGTSEKLCQGRNAQCIAELGQHVVVDPTFPFSTSEDQISSINLPGFRGILVDDPVASLLDCINVSGRQWQANKAEVLDLDAWVRKGLADVLVQESTLRLGGSETCFQLLPNSV